MAAGGGRRKNTAASCFSFISIYWYVEGEIGQSLQFPPRRLLRHFHFAVGTCRNLLLRREDQKLPERPGGQGLGLQNESMFAHIPEFTAAVEMGLTHAIRGQLACMRPLHLTSAFHSRPHITENATPLPATHWPAL